MTEQVYINGEWCALEDAKVSVLDRGFLFGDGIYEMVPVFSGRPYRWERHLQRLTRSLSAIGLSVSMNEQDWLSLIDELVQRNQAQDCGVYIQITRGAAQRDHAFPQQVQPTVFAMCNPIKPMSDAVRAAGVAAVVLDDIRWLRCDIKSVSLLGNVLLRQQAVERGAVEAVLLRDGKVTEGAASNIFVVVDGCVMTPPKSEHLLPGVTRDVVVDILRDQDLMCEETEITEAVLRAADEVWMTSSTKEIVPICRLDDEPVGGGVPGPVWQRTMNLYQAHKEAWRRGESA